MSSLELVPLECVEKSNEISHTTQLYFHKSTTPFITVFLGLRKAGRKGEFDGQIVMWLR